MPQGVGEGGGGLAEKGRGEPTSPLGSPAAPAAHSSLPRSSTGSPPTCTIMRQSWGMLCEVWVYGQERLGDRAWGPRGCQGVRREGAPMQGLSASGLEGADEGQTPFT